METNTNLKELLTYNQRNILSKLLHEVKDSLSEKIIECNKYLRERNDFGATHREDDICETISFTRGKSLGYIESRDEINKLINNLK